MEIGRKIGFLWQWCLWPLMSLALVGCAPKATIPAEISAGLEKFHPEVAMLVAARSMRQSEVMATYINGKKFLRFKQLGKVRGMVEECYKMDTMTFIFVDSTLLYAGYSYEYPELDSAEHSMYQMLNVLGEPEKRLPSVWRYPIRNYIYPDLGLTFTVNVDKGVYTDFEVYQPTTWRRYKRYFWNDPKQYPAYPTYRD
jgi:hypothetical protein